jgi:hypothetical protein
MLKKLGIIILHTYSLLIMAGGSQSRESSSGVGSDVGLRAAQEARTTAKEVAPQLVQASENLGKAAGVDSVKEAGKIVKGVAGAAIIVYGASNVADAYKNLEQQRAREAAAQEENCKLGAACALDNCCLKNIEAPRTEQGVPLPCQKEAAHLALHVGAEDVDKKIRDFNKYAPAPTQTREEYEAKEKEKAKEEPKSKGWGWW